MKILFTGASSFTGFWFVKELSKAGHDITAVFQQPFSTYSGVRKERIEQLQPLCKTLFSMSFGDSSFLQLINEETHWDLLCHHAADVTNYKSPEFNIAKALANNTNNLAMLLESLKQKQCRHILLTGSVFEKNEGVGSDELRAFSPYGLSKTFTAETFHYYTSILGMTLGKFVIPNPFGPYEEPRFTAYLMNNWAAGKPATVSMPNYIRDNIHVSLLAKAYASFAANIVKTTGFSKINPSGYAEAQGDFSERFAREMRKRLTLPCELILTKQTEFPEPRKRINTTTLNLQELHWNEGTAWDELATYYQKQLALT